MNRKTLLYRGMGLLALLMILAAFMGFERQNLPTVEAKNPQHPKNDQTCSTFQLSGTAADTIPVPSACLDGFCKMVIYANDISGPFAEGYSWEVYYYQWPNDGNVWVGGPNIVVGGVEFSDGYGENGNGVSEAVFRGGSYDDGFIRIMDDGYAENDPDLWTIESQGDSELTHATLTVCSIPGVVNYPYISESQAIDMPSFCVDSLCMIFQFSFAAFGGMGPGLSMPVYYSQESSSDTWIGGPNVIMGGIYYSEGAGQNGSGIDIVYGGGETELGGSAALWDDGGEYSDSQWWVDYNDAADMDDVYYWIAPMTCSKYDANTQYTNISTPAYCVDEMCTIIRWTDAMFGAWGPGLSWPVNYKQNSGDNSWKGGPALCIGGICYSSGGGANGDTSAERIFDTGYTDPNGGYVVLRDDSVTALETGPSQWNIVLNAQDDLTTASYYVCSNSCEETILLINKQYLPLLDQ